MTLTELFTQIANAIRTVKKTTDPIKATDFPSEVASIQAGGIENFGKMYLTQTIDGDYCTISLSESGNEENAVMIGYSGSGDEIKIYLVEV